MFWQGDQAKEANKKIPISKWETFSRSHRKRRLALLFRWAWSTISGWIFLVGHWVLAVQILSAENTFSNAPLIPRPFLTVAALVTTRVASQMITV